MARDQVQLPYNTSELWARVSDFQYFREEKEAEKNLNYFVAFLNNSRQMPG
jgi:hypothetical protein